MNLRAAGFLDNSMVNGEGMRSVLFLSGCKRRCPGCQNEAMQDFKYGEDVSAKEVLKRIKGNMPIIKGVTFSGGDPLEQAENLIELSKEIKKLGLNIWAYTGYTYEQILEEKDKNKLELLKYIDVLVDGEFKQDLMENAPKYAGSSNQRIIRLK